jgi:hypothetical protein
MTDCNFSHPPHDTILDYIPNNKCGYPIHIHNMQIKNKMNCCDDYDYWLEGFCFDGDLPLKTWLIIIWFFIEIAIAIYFYYCTLDKKRKIINYNFYDRDDKTYCIMNIYILYFIRIQLVFVVISRVLLMINLFKFDNFKSYFYKSNTPAPRSINTVYSFCK